ncbi:MAG: CRISPR-associated protein Csx15 [Chloroflexaceae bacterium]|jgi:hypothetical protein|nr:CRISPR-associated protein Csx15 [Chloroflexaceae bacterium]
MIVLLNFAHPLTEAQQAEVTALVQADVDVRDVPTQVDRSQPMAEAALQLADAAGLTPVEWQTLPLLVNPPGLAPLALALLAEIHGRRGDFVPVLNVRPVPGSLPTRYEVAEIVHLQAIRDEARTRRSP